VGVWVVVCIQKPSHHFLQTFRPLRIFKIVFRNCSFYPKQYGWAAQVLIALAALPVSVGSWNCCTSSKSAVVDIWCRAPQPLDCNATPHFGRQFYGRERIGESNYHDSQGEFWPKLKQCLTDWTKEALPQSFRTRVFWLFPAFVLRHFLSHCCARNRAFDCVSAGKKEN